MSKELILLDQIRQGDRFALSKAITLMESEDTTKSKEANLILQHCLPYEGRAVRVGITGSPGVGKSTFINALVAYLLNHKLKIAVLAIDPSSEFSKGSILGDKTRMADIIQADEVFIRPSPSKGSLGGITESTYKTGLLLDAANYDFIIIETVGVGQSETFIKTLVDIVILLTIPGSGDELQGIKKGIMEIADIVILNKVESAQDERIKQSLAQLKQAFSYHISPPEILTCSALQKQGFDIIWSHVSHYIQTVKDNGLFTERRLQQKNTWLKHILTEKWKHLLWEKLDKMPLSSVPQGKTLDDYAEEILRALK